MLQENIVHGDLMIDGIGVGDASKIVIEDREKLSQGVVVASVTISKKEKKVIAGPDIQARGLVFLKDNESLMKELTKLFISTVNTELAKNNYSLSYLEQNVKDVAFRTIRRLINKSPMIIPIITEIN